MKTERRHELQTNWLADRVGEVILATKPYMKGLLGVLLAALVLWGTYLYLNHRAEAEEASGWNKLWNGLLGGPTASEDIQSLSESSAKRPTGEWAQLILADNELTAGVGSLFTEKAAGRNLIHSALDGYKAVLTNSTDPLVREHALFGVGRAEESLCDVGEAVTAYKQLREEFPNGSYSARAKSRLDDLARESTVDRYGWFKQIEPKPNVFGPGTGGDKGMQLPSELQPFSQFTPAPSKTPPPEPTPDKGATAPKESPKESKPAETKPAETKTGETKSPNSKTPDTTAPDKSKTGDKASESTPAIPKSTDTKATDTKATDTKSTDTKSSDTKPPSPAPTTEPKPDDSKTAPPKPTDSK